MKIKTIVETCYACPSQWDIKLEDGRMIYARYRYGYLSIRISSDITEDIYDAVSGNEIYGKQLGDNLDGIISEKELQDNLKGIIEW